MLAMLRQVAQCWVSSNIIYSDTCIIMTLDVSAQDVVMPNLDGFEAALAIRALEATAYSGAGNNQRSATGEEGDEVPSRPAKQRRVVVQPVTGAGRQCIGHTRWSSPVHASLRTRENAATPVLNASATTADQRNARWLS